MTNLVAKWSRTADDLAAAVDAPPELEFETFGRQGGNLDQEYSATWSVQEDVVTYGESAVQSGRLPEKGDPTGNAYASVLMTTVRGKGVLTFWWKCNASPREENNYGELVGETLHFGTFKGEFSKDHFTELVEEIEGVTDWCQVTYTNTNDEESVTFAWMFMNQTGENEYEVISNGGGTGWVDHVTWTPDGGSAVDVTPTHSVPYTWLREKFPDAASADEAGLETLAESDSPSGKPMKVWQEYWAGTNPNDPNDLFRAYIAVTNGVPYISWQPDLSVTGDPVRVYHVLCAPSPVLADSIGEHGTPDGGGWVEWPGPGDSGPATNRFFKVELDWEGSR